MKNQRAIRRVLSGLVSSTQGQSLESARVAFEALLRERFAPSEVGSYRGRPVLWVEEAVLAAAGLPPAAPCQLPPGAVAGAWVEEDERGAVSALLAVAGAEPIADVFTFAGDVDVVYTWVDGHDDAWARRRDEALAGHAGSGLHPTASSEGRFEDHEELRYSLRSLAAYAPWVRRVFVVTDGQRPQWLAGHPWVTLVDHSEILPSGDLPTFNSHAIETALHRIPGLAEHFLYFNDDVLLGRRAQPEDFFTPTGATRVFPSEQGLEGDLPVVEAARVNAELMTGLTGRTVRQRYRHTPHAQRVSATCSDSRASSSAETLTRSHRFRHPEDLSFASSLALSYACATGAGVPSPADYLYIDVSGGTRELLRLAKARVARVPLFVCVNQVGEVSPATHRQLDAFLRHTWPLSTGLERAAGLPAAHGEVEA